MQQYIPYTRSISSRGMHLMVSLNQLNLIYNIHMICSRQNLWLIKVFYQWLSHDKTSCQVNYSNHKLVPVSCSEKVKVIFLHFGTGVHLVMRLYGTTCCAVNLIKLITGGLRYRLELTFGNFDII